MFGILKGRLQYLNRNARDQSPTKPLLSVVFACSHDSTIRAFNIGSGRVDAVFTGHERAVYTIALTQSATHPILVSAGYDTTIRLWDPLTRQCLALLKGHTDSIFTLSIINDNTIVSGSGDKDRTIRIWNIKERKCDAILTGHSGGILSLCFISELNCIASCSTDNTIRLWSARDHNVECIMSSHVKAVTSLALLDDGRLASASHDEMIKIWNIAHYMSAVSINATTKAREVNQSAVSFRAHNGPIHALLTLPDNRLASCSRDLTIKIWSTNTFKLLQTLTGHTKDINALVILPPTSLVVSSPTHQQSSSSTVAAAPSPSNNADNINNINHNGMSAGSIRLGSASSDCTIRIWNLDGAGYSEQVIANIGMDNRAFMLYGLTAYNQSVRRSMSRSNLADERKSIIAPSSPGLAGINAIGAGPIRPPRPSLPPPSHGADKSERLRRHRDAIAKRRAEEEEWLNQSQSADNDKIAGGMGEESTNETAERTRFTIPTLPTDQILSQRLLRCVRKYRTAHYLNYADTCDDGFYDDGGIIPGVNQTKVGRERGGGQWNGDVIIFDSTNDVILRALIDTTKRLLRRHVTVKTRVQMLAQLVSNKLGGMSNDIVTAWERLIKRAVKHRESLLTANQSADRRLLMPIGALIGECGLTRHRATLFKYLCDQTVLSCDDWGYDEFGDSDFADDESSTSSMTPPLSAEVEPAGGGAGGGGGGTRRFLPPPEKSPIPASPSPVADAVIGEGNNNDMYDEDLSAAANVANEKNNLAQPAVDDDSPVARPLHKSRSALLSNLQRDEDKEAESPRTPLPTATPPSMNPPPPPQSLVIPCRLIRGQYQYYVPRSRKAKSPSQSVNAADAADDEQKRLGGYHAWNVVAIDGQHYVVDLIYEPGQLYLESSREAMHYNRGRRGSPKQTGLTNLPIRDVRDIEWNELSQVRTLRDGGFGRVETAIWRGMEVVIKTPLTADLYVLRTFQEETRVLNCLSHPNIVQLVGVCTAKKAIILEYINGGDVHTWIKSVAPSDVTLKERLDVAVQAAIGMQYLHGCEPSIVHRDLKTLNLLINQTYVTDTNGLRHMTRVIKVCDFGLARNQKSTAGISTQHKDMGTPAYQSPEQWRDDENERLSVKTDCYSFGGILMELLTGKVPWDGMKSKYVIYQAVVVERKKPIIPSVDYLIPHKLIELIHWCHAYEPYKRPTFPEILRVLRDVVDTLQ